MPLIDQLNELINEKIPRQLKFLQKISSTDFKGSRVFGLRSKQEIFIPHVNHQH